MRISQLAEFKIDPDNSRSWRGISERDRAILLRHQDQGDIPRGIWYSWVPVGSTPFQESDPEQSPGMRRMIESYRKRIDLVIDDGERFWIIEIKPSASYGAMGQALTYLVLFRQRYGEEFPSVPGVFTDALDPDMAELYEAKGIFPFVIEGEAFVAGGRSS